jgi:tetratricopeptide (TPR) repeat protein
MNDVGVLKRPTDYAEMAELALDQGYPGETQAVLEKAFAQKVFTEQRDKDRYQHLLDGAKQRATADLAQLGASENAAAAAPSGDAYLRVGAAYLSYGQNDKALAAINKGIAKGNLKSADEARLLLGITKLRMKSATDAERDFEKVSLSSNSGYARLGRLWALHAGSHTHSA